MENNYQKHLQKSLLLLLKEFDILCKKHDIYYSLHGGTLLGAIREKGFILWDDDVDVTLMRSEYERFKDCLAKENTTLVLREDIAHCSMLGNQTSGYGLPVWIDLFIYDYITENPIGQKLKILGLTVILGMTKTKAAMKISRNGEYKGVKYLAILLFYLFGKLFTMRVKIRFANWFSKKVLTGKKKFIHRSNDQYKALHIILPVQCMSEYQCLPFADTMLMVTKNYHNVLIASYGEDYMIPKQATLSEINAHDIYRQFWSQQ